MKMLYTAFVMTALALSGQALGATCTVSGVTLPFGAYNPFTVTPKDVTGNIAVTCTGIAGEAIAYSIALSTGGSGTYTQRRMTAPPSSTLNYNVYRDATRTIVWGNGSGGSSLVSDSYALTSASTTRNYPVYGRIFANQKAARPAAYSDSIVMTLTF